MLVLLRPLLYSGEKEWEKAFVIGPKAGHELPKFHKIPYENSSLSFSVSFPALSRAQALVLEPMEDSHQMSYLRPRHCHLYPPGYVQRTCSYWLILST